MEPPTDPGVTVPPADPAASAATAQSTPNGSEPVTNPGSTTPEQQVPFSRFQSANDKAKAAEDRAAKAEQELEESRQKQTQTPPPSDDDDDDDIDPSVRNLVTKIIKKEGYVKKDEVDASVSAASEAQNRQRQYQEDTAALTTQYANSGVPFVAEEVRTYAKENGITISSKASLDATYKAMNSDKIIENARNAAVTEFQEGGALSGEKPGSNGATPPEEPQVRGLKNRIAAARQKNATQ